MTEQEERHTIAVLVENEPGVLARVIGLFSGRGYNIDSLTVAEVDAANGRSRINIVTRGTAQVIEQIKALLAKMVPVHHVVDLTQEGAHVERELALIKVAGDRENLVQALRIADFMHARLVGSTTASFGFEITAGAEPIDAVIKLMDPVGLAEVSRAGVVAIARGPGGLSMDDGSGLSEPPLNAAAD
jgi:acetolactate synthase-1/3 small subunit